MDKDSKGLNLTGGESVDVVTRALPRRRNARLRKVREVVSAKLHERSKEIEPTSGRMDGGHQVPLTETGHMCTDWRQEFILLSDTLGCRCWWTAINSAPPLRRVGEHRAPGRSPPTVSRNTRWGQYLPRPEGRGHSSSAGRIPRHRGNPVRARGSTVWQANDEGSNDVQQKGYQPDFNLRGVFTTGADGTYWFRAVKPKFYPIPHDGPAGKLLYDLGRHPYRPAHLHYIVTAPGYDQLTTHIFDPDDPYINSDAVFGVKESLLAEFNWIEDPERAKSVGFEGPFWDVEFDFVLAREEKAA